VAKRPQAPKTQSEKQKEHRQEFRQAVLYAQSAVASPETQEVYKAAAATKKGRTPFNIAVADYFHAPEIHRIDLSDYTGQPGDTIRIEVSDDTLVKMVAVSITNADGSLVEEGEAQSDASGHLWTYTATEVNDNTEGDKITVFVKDLPENITQEEQTLSAQQNRLPEKFRTNSERV
jgi:hypothetical protein